MVLLRWNTSGITVAGETGLNGSTSSRLNLPWDLTLDWSNTLYVSDRQNNRVQKFLRGSLNGSTVAGDADGQSGRNLSRLNDTFGIAVDWNDNLYISDRYNYRIQLWLNGATSGSTIAGTSGSIIARSKSIISFSKINLQFFLGVAGNATDKFDHAYGIDRDSTTGTIYIADFRNDRIMQYTKNASSGTVVAGGNGNGLQTNQLNHPYAVYFDSFSNYLYIANGVANNTVRWKIGSTNWTLVAGSPNGTGGGSSTLLSTPTDITLDPMGNIYIADRRNHRIQWFEVGQSNGTTIAGITSVPGSTSTRLAEPVSLMLDNQLNLFVVDSRNHRIQKFLRY